MLCKQVVAAKKPSTRRTRMFKIVKREEMAEGTVILNEIEAPLIAKKAKPGQFVILKANEDGERIPLTMADTDPDKGTLTIITDFHAFK